MKKRKTRFLINEAQQVFSPNKRLNRSIYLLPTVFTVGNLFAGFFAVISTLNKDYQYAAMAIGIAVVLDGLDGRVARLANATSDFGLQLDSLADVISFGLAPAILIYSWGLSELGDFARLSAFVFLICGAMRLARFNVQVQQLKHFAGLPIPAGAGFVAATVHFFGHSPESAPFKFYLIIMTFLVSFLMISTLRYPSLKQLNLGRGKSHLSVLLLALLIAGFIWYSRNVLMAIAAIYICTGPFSRAYQFARYRLREPRKLPAREPHPD